MGLVLLTVIAIWAGLAVPAAIFVAAIGRSGLREDQALGHVPTSSEPAHDAVPAADRAGAASALRGPGNGTTSPLVAAGRWGDAARHDG
jgi:hypothetical protein